MTDPKELRTNTGYLMTFGFLYRGTWGSLVHSTAVILLTIMASLHYAMQIYECGTEMGVLLVMENVHWIIVCTSDWVCSLVFMLGTNTFYRLRDTISQGFHNSPSDLTQQMLQARTKANNQVVDVTNKITLAVVVGLTGAIIKEPLFGEGRAWVLPLHGWFPFKIDSSLSYAVALSFQIAFSSNVCMCEGTLMVGFVALAGHLCSELEQLKIAVLDFDEVTRTHGSLAAKKHVKSCIRRHYLILQYFDDLQSLYNYIFLTTTLATALKFCTLGYLITDPGVSFGALLSFTAVLCVQLTTAITYCWFGQKIKAEGEKVREAVYSVKWYAEDSGLSRYLLLMMLRSSTPLTLSGASLQRFNLEGLTEILIMSYSYFNMVTALRGNKLATSN